jgi:plasmid stabilization system protein ParE
MELKIFWTDFSKKQLRKIFAFYHENVSLRIAQKLTIGIVKKTFILNTRPKVGQKEELLEDRKQEFRYLVFKNYKIIYWINYQKNQVEISDIFDTRQNPTKMERND